MFTVAADCVHRAGTDVQATDVGASPPSAGPSPAATPFDVERVSISRREWVELKMQASQYRSLHARAVERLKWMQLRQDRELAQAREQLTKLQAELILARAKVRDLRQRVFGTKTEQSHSVNAVRVPAVPVAPRARGQQRGRRGHGRTHLPRLASVVEDVRSTINCPRCGAEATPAWDTDDAQVLEIEVKAYRRIVRRQRYRPACRCGCLPGLMSAAAPDALWPRNKLGVSIWVELLPSKFLYGQPTARLLQDWTERGLPIAQGTVTEGMRRLAPLFEPILAACLGEIRASSHWHADETRWEVFEDLPGKTGHRWYLWVFKAERAICFVLDPSRSAAVPTKTLAATEGGILSVDRYAAYGKFARSVPGMRLALCWAHQRRDFLRVASDHPALWVWAMQWVERIGELYELHRARRMLMNDASSVAFVETDSKLREHVALLDRQRDSQLADPQLAAPARKVLRVMKSYWPGLVAFVENPLTWTTTVGADRKLSHF